MTPAGRRDARGPGRPVGVAGFGAFIAGLAAALLIVAAGVLYVAVEMTLSPARWLDALEAGNAYDRAPAAIAEQIVTWVDGLPSDHPRTLEPLDRSDVEAIAFALAPPDWLRSEAQRVVPALVDGVVASGQVHAIVALDTLKARLTGPTVLGVVLDRIATWPACTVAQSIDLLGDHPPRCRPTAVSSGQLAVVVAGRFSVVAAELPDSVDLATPGDAPGAGVLATAGINDILRLAAAARTGLPLAVLAVIVLLLIGAALALTAGSRGWRLITRRLGATVLAGGIGLLVLSLGIDSLLAAVVGGIRGALADGGMAPRLVTVVGSASLVMVDRAGWLFVLLAAPLIAGGLALIAAGWLVAGRVRTVTAP